MGEIVGALIVTHTPRIADEAAAPEFTREMIRGMHELAGVVARLRPDVIVQSSTHSHRGKTLSFPIGRGGGAGVHARDDPRHARARRRRRATPSRRYRAVLDAFSSRKNFEFSDRTRRRRRSSRAR